MPPVHPWSLENPKIRSIASRGWTQPDGRRIAQKSSRIVKKSCYDGNTKHRPSGARPKAAKGHKLMLDTILQPATGYAFKPVPAKIERNGLRRSTSLL